MQEHEPHDIFDEEEGDVYCEVKACKKQGVVGLCFVCIGCTIKYEAKNKAKFLSCCGAEAVNHSFTNKEKFIKHLDTHRSRGEFVPERYYDMEKK